MEQNPLRDMMKARRDELGLTQKDAAKRAGVHVTTWNRWEGEFSTPEERVWHRIASALDLELEDVRRAMFQKLEDHFSEIKSSTLFEGYLKNGTTAAPFKLHNPQLAELAGRLEVDFSHVDSAAMQLYLDDNRALLRNQIIAADLHILSLRHAVELYRRFALSILGLPKAIFRPANVSVRVRRKAEQKSSKDGAKRE